MIVYVEAVILDNFCLDALLAYLTVSLTRERVRVGPILLSAAFGSVVALLFPLVPDRFAPLVKVATLFASVAFFSRKGSLRRFIVNVFLYALLSFCLCGILSFLLGSNDKGLIGVSFGGAVSVLSIAALSIVYSVRQIGGLIREKKRSERTVVAELINDEKHVRLNALLDSGNLLTDEKGEGVVVTDPRFLTSLGTLDSVGAMQVRTASGSKVLSLVKIPEIKIYSREGENILTNVTAALSELPDEYALILPCE